MEKILRVGAIAVFSLGIVYIGVLVWNIYELASAI